MATALSYSKYYLEQEEIKVYNSLSTLKKISRLIDKSTQNSGLTTEDIESKNQNINQLKVEFIEERIALLEGGSAALAVKSFLEARRLLLKNLAGYGDNILTINASSLLFDKTITSDLKIEVRNAYDSKHSTLSSFTDQNTKAIYLETIASDFSIPDFLRISSFAKALEIPLIVDNTSGILGFVSTPLRNGADIVITDIKELLKSSDEVIGAVIIDGGTFNWNSDKFNQFIGYKNLYHSSNHNKFLLVEYLRNQYNRLYNTDTVTESILKLVSEIGFSSSFFKQQSGAALEIAKWLHTRQEVKSVDYNGLPSNASYFNALRYLKNGFGNKLKFQLNLSENAVKQFASTLLERIQLNKTDDQYQIILNPTDLSIEVAIYSVSSQNIIRDFEDALQELFSNNI